MTAMTTAVHLRSAGIAVLVIATGIAAPAFAGDGATPASQARFYVVDASGRSVPDPSVRYVKPKPRPAPVEKVAAPGPTRVRVRIESSPRRRDAFEEARCENAGFFYTSDGRCVMPAGMRVPRRR